MTFTATFAIAMFRAAEVVLTNDIALGFEAIEWRSAWIKVGGGGQCTELKPHPL